MSSFTTQLLNDERLGTDPDVSAELNVVLLEARKKLKAIAGRVARDEHEREAIVGRLDRWLLNFKRMLAANFSR